MHTFGIVINILLKKASNLNIVKRNQANKAFVHKQNFTKMDEVQHTVHAKNITNLPEQKKPLHSPLQAHVASQFISTEQDPSF